jgi:hypothetical protein
MARPTWLLAMVACTRVTAETPPAPSPPPAPRPAWFRFEERARPRAAEEPPLSLTAGDGTGLALASLRARAFVDHPLALTELHLVFENPEARDLEGRFRIALPAGASVSRFAMRVGGGWQEGEVVELQAARRAYEDFLHRKQDPALLEQAAGNEFSARVFPIPARGRKELIVTYSEELAEGPYRLPLRGLPRVGALDVEIRRRGAPAVRESRLGVVPDRDLVVEAGRRAAGLRSGELVVARVVPVGDAAPGEIDSLLVLFDTSASRALGFARGVALLSELIAGLAAGANPPIAVAAFDQEVELVYEGRAAQFDASRLRARGALGASDLAAALRWAAGRGHRRLLVIGDGVSTAGDEPAPPAFERVDAIALGGIRDDAALRRIARDGAVIDGRLEAPEIAARLLRPARAGVTIAVEGAEWFHPRQVDGVQAGDAVLVFASLPAGVPLRIRVDGAEQPIGELGPAEPALLERAAARARIAALLEEKAAAGADRASALREQITRLSLRHRVISPYTALLVLETEDDYRRFGIDRAALADILTVGDEGIAAVDRRAGPAPSRGGRRARAERPAEEDERPAARDDAPKEKKRLAMIADEAPPPRSPEPHAAGESHGYAARAVAPEPPRVAPHTGPFREVTALLRRGRRDEALARARAWRAEAPGDVLALLALGEALEAAGDAAAAARAYGSLIDLFPDRADLRRHAGERLDRLESAAARALAVDTYRRAAAQRPDHPASHRLLAFAHLRAGELEAGFEALAAGLARAYPEGRFAGARQVLAEDLGLIAAAWTRAEPARAGEIRRRLRAAGGRAETAPSLRFVLVWETDANDVDFHIRDRAGNHASYQSPELASGGRLYADVTTGYGPECFTVRGARRAGPYTLQAHYYARGPMGYGMGKLEIVEHDGEGGLRFEQRPFVVMQDGAFVELGTAR